MPRRPRLYCPAVLQVIYRGKQIHGFPTDLSSIGHYCPPTYATRISKNKRLLGWTYEDLFDSGKTRGIPEHVFDLVADVLREKLSPRYPFGSVSQKALDRITGHLE